MCFRSWLFRPIAEFVRSIAQLALPWRPQIRDLVRMGVTLPCQSSRPHSYLISGEHYSKRNGRSFSWGGLASNASTALPHPASSGATLEPPECTALPQHLPQLPAFVHAPGTPPAPAARHQHATHYSSTPHDDQTPRPAHICITLPHEAR